jgi:hypothetical protein
MSNFKARKKLRTDLRKQRQLGKISAKNVRKTAKLSVKESKKLGKIYGDLDPEEVNAINSVQPYLGVMKEKLDKEGVPYDEEDPIEVANKYAFVEDEIESPLEEEQFENLYMSNIELADGGKSRMGTVGGKIAKGAFSFISAGVKSLVGDAQAKKRAGEELTPTESKLLEANQVVRQEVKAGAMDEIKGYLPIVVLVLIVLLVLKK